jgi:3',5'-cyclic-AMP phosphodiesterase
MPNRMVIQISDTHIVADGLLHDRVDSYANLRSIFEQIESSEDKPDAILLSGDLADHGLEAEYDRLRALVSPFAERLGLPVVYMPGNHDDLEQFRTSLFAGLGEGPIDHTIWVGGLRIICLDSSVVGAHHGELSSEQLHALATELSHAAPEGTILAIHHPPIPSPVRIVNLLSLRDPEKLVEVIRGTDVMMLLAGHAHHATAGLFAGIPVWIATASAYQADVLAGPDVLRGLPGVAYTRVDVLDGAAYATQVATAFGQVPVYEHPMAGIEERIAAMASNH